MSVTEERLRVLTMIEEGKITAEQGAQLLEALKQTTVQQHLAAVCGYEVLGTGDCLCGAEELDGRFVHVR